MRRRFSSSVGRQAISQCRDYADMLATLLGQAGWIFFSMFVPPSPPSPPSATSKYPFNPVLTSPPLSFSYQNAGIGIGAPSLEELSLSDFSKTIAINLIAPFHCVKAAFMQMKSQSPQGGRIINNGSISAYTPRPGSAGYTASKHGISGLTKVSLSAPLCFLSKEIDGSGHGQTAALDGRKYNISVSQIDM